jgi:DNA polymerase I
MVPKKAAMIKGRVHVDLYRIVNRHLQLNSPTIQSVYLELFGEDLYNISTNLLINQINLLLLYI